MEQQLSAAVAVRKGKAVLALAASVVKLTAGMQKTTMTMPHLWRSSLRIPIAFAMAISWVAWLILFFSYAIRERMRIGHWPFFLDPETMGLPRFPVHDAIVGYALLAVFGFSVLGSVALLIHSLAVRPRQPLQGLAAVAIGWLPLVLGVIFAPEGVFEWFFD